MMRRRRLSLPLVVLVAAVTALVVLGVVVLAPTSLHAPVGSAAAVPDSELVRKYPLGERPLCCGPDAASRGAARAPSSDSADGGGLEWPLVALALTAVLGALFARRFTWADGAWVRVRQRRRLCVGPTIYRWARSAGFRYSVPRDALVLRALGGSFGPVLTLRPDTAPPSRPRTPPPRRAPLRTTARRPAASSPARTIDLACRLLPHRHRSAQLWQLTAVDLRSRFVWAELVRRRGGPPTAPQLAAFLRRIARELEDAGEHLSAVSAPARALPLLDGVPLPAGTHLVAAKATDAGATTASDIHELLVDRHWRTAFIPPAAPPLGDLRRRLQAWVAGYNTQRHGTSPPLMWLPSRG